MLSEENPVIICPLFSRTLSDFKKNMDTQLTVGWKWKHPHERKELSPLSSSWVPLADLMRGTTLMSQLFFVSVCNLLPPLPLLFLPEGFCLWVSMHLILSVLLLVCVIHADSPNQKVLPKLGICQPEERIPGDQSFQVRPLHRSLTPFMSIPYMAVNS